MTPELAQFVWEHRSDDPFQLALLRDRYPNIPLSVAAAQIESLAKIKSKVPSWYRPGIWLPPRLSVEQASSEATARFKAALISGQSALDLTCGMGVDAFFLSQRVEHLTVLEQNPRVAESARHNFSLLGAKNIRVLEDDAMTSGQWRVGTYDWIYADPARRDHQLKRVFHWKDCSPNILALRDALFQHTGNLLLKAAPMLDIDLSVKELACVAGVWILEYAAEVKEVLYQLGTTQTDPARVPIRAIGIDATGQPIYTFESYREAERQHPLLVSMPMDFLYEPPPAILKSGALKSFGQRYRLSKLHENTALFTSNAYIGDVPGRAFEIVEVGRYDKKWVRVRAPEGKANMATRNFPDSPEVMARKLGLSPGGSVFLFGATLADGQKAILCCRKVAVRPA
jgi:SAM-dependent methyltransferase